MGSCPLPTRRVGTGQSGAERLPFHADPYLPLYPSLNHNKRRLPAFRFCIFLYDTSILRTVGWVGCSLLPDDHANAWIDLLHLAANHIQHAPALRRLHHHRGDTNLFARQWAADLEDGGGGQAVPYQDSQGR